jgi:hypothetical protein
MCVRIDMHLSLKIRLCKFSNILTFIGVAVYWRLKSEMSNKIRQTTLNRRCRLRWRRDDIGLYVAEILTVQHLNLQRAYLEHAEKFKRLTELITHEVTWILSSWLVKIYCWLNRQKSSRSVIYDLYVVG